MWWVFGAVAGIERAIMGTSARFLEPERRPTMARTNDVPSVEDLLAASGGMEGLKDALQELIEAEVTARLGAGRLRTL